MKNLLAIFAFFFAVTSLVQAQDKKAPVSPKVTVESPDKNIKVVYGQPSKKGRIIFGADGSSSLEKYGKVWRTGANEATEVTFKTDVMFGDKMVKAGTYTLFTIPGEKEWSVLLNSTLGQWGAYDYEKVKGTDVAMIKVPVSMNKNPHRKTNHHARQQQHRYCLGQHDHLGTRHETRLRLLARTQYLTFYWWLPGETQSNRLGFFVYKLFVN